uniref:HIRA interacting protein 3 n=1 Tax=Cyclopterus lumpus TaxID=8103 RepID=A0A8C2XIW3_CYCLU
MVSEEEATAIRKFVCGQLRGEPNLSTLTLGILKKRYLAHVRCETLGPEARNIMKLVVKEELIKMQVSEFFLYSCVSNFSELLHCKPLSFLVRLMTESVEKDNCKTGSESEEEGNNSEYEDAEQEVKQSLRKTNAKGKQQISSKDSTDEEINKSEENKEKEKSLCEDNPKVMKKANATKNGGKRSSNTSQGEKTPQSNEENETDTDGKSEKSEKINGNDSSDDSENGDYNFMFAYPVLKCLLNSRFSVVRLKRYISLCGVRLNYKKLLDGCRSVRSQVAALKKELEGLGVHGQPSIMKCKKVRMKREESQELAELDVSNIIATEGRPKRRATSAWQEQHNAPTSTYLRSLNSGSDSDEESNTHRGRRRATDWTNLQGVISDDAESN